MGEKTLNIRIKNKYDTEANWTKNNPVLLAGETAYSSDKSGKYKIGDGTHKWSELSYAKADLVKSDVTTALGYTPPTNNTWRGIQNNLTSDSATDSLAAAQGKVLKGLVDGKLPLTGGTMTGTAMITWPDSGNWSNSNKDVTFPVVRGGLSWNGQSDGIQLYAVETGNDNLELYLKFTDDNSNGLSIRNNKNTQTARIAADGTITASSFVGNLNGTASAAPWSGITGKPTSYPPSSHTHNYAGSSSAGGNAYNANALYVNPSTRQTSANYDLTNDTYAHRITYSVASSTMTTAKPPSDAHILTFGWDTNAGYGAQFAVGSSFSNHLYIRGAKSETKDNKNVCTWESSWRTVLDSGNYTSYTVTKTGSGASGTWGISVTGNAATATKLATARSINGTNFDGSGNITTATWGTARNVTIGNTKKSVNGASDVAWSLSEIGAAAASHSHSYLPLSGGTLTGNLNLKPASGEGGEIHLDASTANRTENGIILDQQGGNFRIFGVPSADGTTKTGSGTPLVINPYSKTITGGYTLTGNLSGNASSASSVPWTGVTGRPSSLPASDVYAWAKASTKPSYTKAEVGLGSVDNTADSAKSVKYATSAGSANAVAWANVSGKPSITGKQTRTLTASGPSGWKDAATDQGFVPDMAFMAYWNGAYSGSSSNLAYCNRGAFGTIVTKNAGDYATASHTHHYAGSSSAGGNANAAVKLATARKIGNASFDGTADITLSQMGLNVPVEITKANYLAKKKAGTLNANTYYNVIDEYDSANVINDSSVTTNSAFSSTKSEKTYAKKSAIINTTLTASKWTGSSAPYTYVLPVSGATTSNIVEINYASNASSQAIEAYQNAMLADGGQTTNQITIKATEKPTVDIPITIVIRNDL